MTRRHSPRPPRRGALAIVEAGLWLAGGLAIAWCFLVLVEGALYQAVEGRQLASAAAVATADLGASATAPEVPASGEARAATTSGGDGLAPIAGPRSALPAEEAPADGALDALWRQAARLLPGSASLGRLEIPRLGLSVVVAEGTEARTLRRAVGHLPETPRPGEPGNVVIAGHRDRHFRPLEAIQSGDEVTLSTEAGRFRYRVVWTRVVPPHAVHLIAPTPEPSLTLVTCYPFTYVGTAPARFVVRARQVAAEPNTSS